MFIHSFFQISTRLANVTSITIPTINFTILVDDNSIIIDGRSIPTPFYIKHNIITSTILYNTETNVSTPFQYRDFKNISPSSLGEYLSCFDWSPFGAADVNIALALGCLCNNFMAAVESHTPLKTFMSKKGRLSWVDADLAQLYRKRDALYRRYKRTKDSKYLQNFYTLRKQVDELTESARTSFYCSRLFDALSSNTGWKELRSLVLMPGQEGELNDFSPEELNKYFTGVSISLLDDGQRMAFVLRK